MRRSALNWGVGFLILIMLSSILLSNLALAETPYTETTPAKGVGIMATGANIVLTSAFYFLVALIRINPCVVGETGDYCVYFKNSAFFYFQLQEDTTVKNINGTLLKMFVPFFVTLLILLGLYLIFMQGSVRGRAQAKSMLLDIFIGLVLTSLSPLIFQTLLNISGEIVDAMALSVETELTSIWDIFRAPAGAAIIGLCIYTSGTWFVQMALLVAAIRYFVVMVCAALFPLGIFLWSFRLTKGMGNAIINFSIAIIFTQVFQMGFLAMGITFITSGGSGITNAILMLGSFLGIILTPLLVSKVLPWIGGTLFAYSSRGGGAFTRPLGLMMQGSSFASAITAAGGRYQTTHTMGAFERGGGNITSPGWLPRDVSGEEAVAYNESGYYAGERAGFYSMTPGTRGMAFMASGEYDYARPGQSFSSYSRRTTSGAGSSSVRRAGQPLDNVTPAASERAREPSKITPSAPAKEPGGHAPLGEVRAATEAVRGAMVSPPAAGGGAVVPEVGVPSKAAAAPPGTQFEGESVGDELDRQKDLSGLWRNREREKYAESEQERKEELSEAAGEGIPEGEMPPTPSGARITESDYVKRLGRRLARGESVTVGPEMAEKPYRGNYVGFDEEKGKGYIDDEHRRNIAAALKKGGVKPSDSIVDRVGEVLIKHEEVEREMYAKALKGGASEADARKEAHEAGMMAEADDIMKAEDRGYKKLRPAMHALWESYEVADYRAAPGRDYRGRGELGLQAEGRPFRDILHDVEEKHNMTALTRGGGFLHVLDFDNLPPESPENYWKMHISPKRENLPEVLDKTAELAKKHNIDFKVPLNDDALDDMYESGKVITLYPTSEEKAKAFVKDFAEAFSDMKGVGVRPQEGQKLNPEPDLHNGLLSARWGRHSGEEAPRPDNVKDILPELKAIAEGARTEVAEMPKAVGEITTSDAEVARVEAPSAVERPKREVPAGLGSWMAHLDERRLERLKPDEAEKVKEVFGRVEAAGLSDRFKDKGAVVGDLVSKAEKAPQILEEGADGRSVADKMLRKAADAGNPEEELKGWEVAICEECGMPFIKQKRGK